MKAQILKIAGVKSEKEFYKKYPSEKAFMKVHSKEFKKAAMGAAIGGVPNSYYGNNNTEFESGFGQPQIQPIGGNIQPAGLFKSAAQVPTAQVPTAQQLQGQGQGNSTMDTINKFAGPIGDLAKGYQALRGERTERKQAQQNLAISDVTKKASSLREKYQPGKYNRPEDIKTTGEEFSSIYGTGTNALVKNGGAIRKAQNGLDGEDLNDDLINKYPTYNDHPQSMGPQEAPAGYQEEPAFDTNSARDTWVNKTGRPWSEAKKLGYTNGSAKDNIKLLSELNDPRFKKENLRDSAPSKGTASRTPVQHRETPSGRLTAIKPSAQSYTEAMKGKPKYSGNQGDIHTPDEGTMFNRMGERLANPIQTLGHYSKYGEAPAEGFSKHSKNAYDQALGLENPFYWANAMGNAVDYATEGDYAKAGIEALDALPAIGKVKYTKDLPYLMGLPEARAAGQRAAGYLGEGATRITGPASKQIGRGVAKQLKQPFTPNFTMHQNGGAIGGNSTEIQNTYDDGRDIYSDISYEPLNDSSQQKSFRDGGDIYRMASGGMSPDMYGKLGHMATGAGQSLLGGQNAGGQLGATAGKAIGNIFLPGLGGAAGELIGGIAGNVFDTNAKQTKKFNTGIQANENAMAFNSNSQAFQEEHNATVQNGGELESYKDGGYLSHDWLPQVITSFGDHSPKDVYDFAHEGMDTLRAGGNMRDYTPPSEQAMETYKDGGDIEVLWGGKMKPISQNPYLPEGGITYLPQGQSHTESDKNNNTGIGVAFGDNPNPNKNNKFELERNEPTTKLKDGSTGNSNLVVYGNLSLDKNIASQFNDPKLTAIADEHHNKKLKNIALDYAKDEAKQNKIINSYSTKLADHKDDTNMGKLVKNGYEKMFEGAHLKLKEIANNKITLANYQSAVNDTKDEISEGVGKNISAEHLAKGLIKLDKDPVTMNAKWGDTIDKAKSGKRAKVLPLVSDLKSSGLATSELASKSVLKPEMPTAQRLHINRFAKAAEDDSNDLTELPWEPYANQALKYLRPSNEQAMDYQQMYPEWNAMASNQLEPVPSQHFNPQLNVSSDISMQTERNAVTARDRALQKQLGYNPSAQGNLAPNAYDAMNEINQREFIANQGKKDQVYSSNVAAMNDAQKINLGIDAAQWDKQALAKSNTKATTQAAISSMSDKYAKHRLENKTLGIGQNMYNFRFDKNGVATNWNPLHDFGTEVTGAKTDATKEKTAVSKNGSNVKKNQKNSSVVRAYKNL